MNTFGSLKYLEAESNVVEELVLNLKDQLNKLKIEELAIRAAIRRRLREEQDNPSALDSRLAPPQLVQGNEFARQVQDRYQTASTSRPISNLTAEQSDFDMSDAQQPTQQNKPIEVSISAALEMIGRYRQRDFIPTGEEHTLDPAEGEVAEFEDTELDETEIDDETELDEPTSRTLNELSFLDLRTASPDEAEES